MAEHIGALEPRVARRRQHDGGDNARRPRVAMDQISGFWVGILAGAGVYALICGAFGAYVAGEKGRSGREGFLFGLFLGPIGVVAVACLPDTRTILAATPAAAQSPGTPEFVDRDEDDQVRAALAQMESKLRRVVHRDRRSPGATETSGGPVQQQPRMPDSWIAPT
jgi:hypothetical protein